MEKGISDFRFISYPKSFTFRARWSNKNIVAELLHATWKPQMLKICANRILQSENSIENTIETPIQFQNISMFFTSSIFSALVYILVLVLVFFLIWTSDTILYQITILLHFTSINGLKRYKTKSLAKIIYEFIFLTNGSTIGYVNKNGKMALLFLVHKKLYKKIWNMLSIIHSIGHLLNAYISFARVHTNRHIKSATVLSSKSFSRHYQKINCAVCTFNDDHFITLRNNIFIFSFHRQTCDIQMV